MLILNLYIFFQIQSMVFSLPFVFNATEIRLDRVDGSCRGEKVKLQTKFNLIKTDERFFSFNSTVDVFENINFDPTIEMKIFRCRSKENPDTCEEYLKTKPSSYCKMIDPDNRLSPIHLKHEPEYKCPLKKGKYYVYNGKFDAAPFIVFRLDNWYWKFLNEGKDPQTGEMNDQVVGLDYIMTFPGMVKIAQVVVNFVGMICISATGLSSKGDAFLACSILALLITGALILCYMTALVLKIQIPWYRIEFFYSVIWAVFYLIVSALVVSVNINGYIAGGVFGFMATALYAGDAYLKFRLVMAS